MSKHDKHDPDEVVARWMRRFSTQARLHQFQVAFLALLEAMFVPPIRWLVVRLDRATKLRR